MNLLVFLFCIQWQWFYFLLYLCLLWLWMLLYLQKLSLVTIYSLTWYLFWYFDCLPHKYIPKSIVLCVDLVVGKYWRWLRYWLLFFVIPLERSLKFFENVPMTISVAVFPQWLDVEGFGVLNVVSDTRNLRLTNLFL